MVDGVHGDTIRLAVGVLLRKEIVIILAHVA